MSGKVLTDPVWLVLLSPGDSIIVTRYGKVRFRGTVDEVSSRLGLVWIRESDLGERKLFCRPDYAFHRADGAERLAPDSDSKIDP